MKLLILVFAYMMIASSAGAWQQRAMPAACHETDSAIQELQRDGFEPHVVSKFTVNPPEKLIVVWVNASRHVVVTVSQDLENASVTCIVAIGNTDTIILPDREKPDL